MAQPFFSGEEIDKMKADAIRRARQMHSRSAISNMPHNHQADGQKQAPPKKEGDTPKAPPQKKPVGIQNLLQMIKMMGFENDQLILTALILLLAQEEDNLPIILALLYIAM